MTQVATGSSTALEEAVQNAAVARPQPGKKTLQDEVRSLMPQLAAAIPKGTVEPERFVRTILTEIRKTPKLLNCTRESFLGAMMQLAQLGLEVGNTLGHAYLIPYKNECTLQIGYKGYLELAFRGGILMEAREIRDNDEFEFDYGQERPLQRHKWKVGQDRGDIIGYYSTAALPDGRLKLLVMDEAEIEARRLRSKAKDDGPWKTDRAAMSRKTLIRALVPQVPMSTELSEAIKVDEATVTRDAKGDLNVTYDEPGEPPPAIDARSTDVTLDMKRDALIEAMNAIEPNAARLDCSRQVFKAFGAPENMTEDDYDRAISVAERWPDSQAELGGAPMAEAAPQAQDAEVRPGEEPVLEEAGTDLDGLLDSLPAEWAAECEQAITEQFGDAWDGDMPEVVEWAQAWVGSREAQEAGETAAGGPEGALFPADSPPPSPADNTGLAGQGVPKDLLEGTKRQVDFWDAETCNRVLGQFGLPKTGNVESKRARLVVRLAELRELGDPAATDLF